MVKPLSWAQRIKALQLRHSSEIETLADARVTDALIEWRATYPDRPLRIGFGMGAEWIEIQGRSCDVDLESGELRIAPKSAPHSTIRLPFKGNAVKRLLEALSDVLELTDGYRRGCPADASTAELPGRRAAQ